jgi:cobalt-zinc-cadmium efflux system protein
VFHNGHSHDVAGMRKRALWLALGFNAAFLVVEVVAAGAFGSLALLADAAHMGSDVAALGIALVAQRLIERPATARHSYGLQRADVLAAQLNGFGLVAVTVWIFYEAVGRLRDPADVAGGGLLVVALLGLAVNVASARVLHRARGHSLNMHGAFAHMAADAGSSFGAVLAGAAVLLWNATWADAAASMLIGVLVLWSAYGLLRDATQVLLEGTPAGIDPDEVTGAISDDADVELVHHVHVWNLASDTPALSGHVVLRGGMSLHDAQQRADQLKAMLAERLGIDHATLELECHPCSPVLPARVTLVDDRRTR